MQLNGRTFDQDRFKCLDTQTVQGWRTVQHHRTFTDHLFQNFPDLGAVAFDQAAGTLDVGGVAMLAQAGNDEGHVKFQCHGLWQTALVQLELRTDNNNGTAGIVDTFP